MNVFNTPFIIPVVAMLIPIVAILAGVFGQAQARRVKADQRMAMLARGMSLDDIERLVGTREQDAAPLTRDPLRSLANARRAGIVLCAVGLGLILFGCILTWIVQVREVYSVAAAGLIPFAIGIGFFIDYHLQKRELARFGMEIDPPTPR